MKKKSLLIFLLAAVSAVTVGLVGCKKDHTHSYTDWDSDSTKHWKVCPDDGEIDEDSKAPHKDANSDGECDECGEHVHVYTAWGSDDDKHWKKCPDDNTADTSTEAAHKDENSNGYCDDCNYKYSYSVTFNMHGHGTAPEAQKVAYGEKANEPALSDTELAEIYDEGWEFDGWYTDDTYATEFDFNEDTITSTTVIHAHWVVADYIANPIILTLDTASFNKFTGNKLYFTFTATTAGRYALTVANNGCTYSLDANKASNNLINLENKYYFTLAAGEKVGIMATKPAEWNDETLLSLQVSGVTYEPLPTTGYKSGTYTDGYFTLVFDRGTGDGRGSLTLTTGDNDGDPVSYNYVDGKVRFSIYYANVNETTDYTLTWTGEDEFTLEYKGSGFGGTQKEVLTLDVPVEPIDLAKFAGKYTLAQGETAVRYSEVDILELHIYANGSGYYKSSTTVEHFTVDPSGDYDKKNVLHWYALTITVTLDDSGDAESVKVTYYNLSATYTRAGNAVELPAKLPLEVGVEYTGGNYTLKTEASRNTLSKNGGYNWGIYITAVSGNTYTFIYSSDDKTYKLELVKDGADVTEIKLYEADGTTLIATLTEHVDVITHPDLPTDGTAVTFTVEEDGYENFFTVAEDGTYRLSIVNGSIKIFTDEDDEDVYYYHTSGDTVYLKEGTVISVTITDENSPLVFTSEKIASYEYLPLDEEIEVSSSDEFGGKRFFEIEEEGTYEFTISDHSSDHSTVWNIYYYNDGYSATAAPSGTIDGDVTKILPAGAVIYVDVARTGSYVTFTVTKVVVGDNTPGTENNPINLNENGGEGSILAPNKESHYYFTYTAPTAGNYKVYAYYVPSWGGEGHIVHYKVNGADAGVLQSAGLTTTWVDGYSSDKYWTVVTVDEGGKIDIVADFNNCNLQDNLHVKVEMMSSGDGSATDPYIVDSLGTFNFDLGDYVTITAPAAVDIEISLLDDTNGMIPTKFCFIDGNGTHYGYYDDNWEWVAHDAGTSLILNGGESVTIHIIVDDGFTESFDGKITLKVAEYVGSGSIEDGTQEHPFLIKLVRGSYTDSNDAVAAVYYQFDDEEGPYTISIMCSGNYSITINNSPVNISSAITLHKGDIICIDAWAPYTLTIYPASVD